MNTHIGSVADTVSGFCEPTPCCKGEGSSTAQPVSDGLLASMLAVLDKLLHWAAVARQRRQLKVLSADPVFLNDVGLTRTDALEEANKPFWKL